jgi:hypothetical protein
MNAEPLIFISHAGSDHEQAQTIANALKNCHISVIMDSLELVTGSNFVDFINAALDSADYCLLLWSRAAEQREFVKAEWHAAFAKEVNLHRIFLLVGRLEDHSVPVLLQPRIYIDFFPTIEPGIAKLVSTWKKDRYANATLKKLVLPPLDPTIALGNAVSPLVELYCSSELFDCVFPIPADLNKPAGLLLHYVIEKLQLPANLALPNEVLGMKLSYQLLYDGKALDRQQTLHSHGISAGAILNLEITTEVFSRVAATSVSKSGRRRYRGGSSLEQEELLKVLADRGLRSNVL